VLAVDVGQQLGKLLREHSRHGEWQWVDHRDDPVRAGQDGCGFGADEAGQVERDEEGSPGRSGEGSSRSFADYLDYIDPLPVTEGNVVSLTFVPTTIAGQDPMRVVFDVSAREMLASKERCACHRAAYLRGGIYHALAKGFVERAEPRRDKT
jgi:hypothetical protein